jgi:phenylacetate-coenzyme A ligase PaaK-like adenylate-forming protein
MPSPAEPTNSQPPFLDAKPLPGATPDQKKRATRVWRRHRGSTDALIGHKRALHVTGREDRAFLRAMSEAFSYHYLGSLDFQRLCAEQNFFPWDLKRTEQIPEIPYFFVTALKYHEVMSVDPERVVLTLKSSGTSGQTSAIYLDRTSLRRIKRIVRHIYHDLGMVSNVRTNYLCFTYDPEVAKDVGTAFSDKLLTDLTRVNHVCYAIAWDEQKNDWHLDVDRVARTLERFETAQKPFRVLGFPAHTWSVLQQIVEERGRNFRFGPNSFVITGGGWKNFDDQRIDKRVFREQVGRWLGIPTRNVRDLYGMVEHGVPYCECEEWRMHVPSLSRVYVRDPLTLKILPAGRPGLLHFVTPYHHSFPAISLLTTDRGILHPECRCGRKTPVVQLLGRAGVTKHKGCAIAALKVGVGKEA